MATLTIINDDVATEDFDRIRIFASEQGIELGHIELPPRARELAARTTLTDPERAELIALYPDAHRRFAAERGFRADVVCFYPELPQLDFIINKFGSIHYHYEHEYWYFVDGEACFGFLGANGTKLTLRVQAGEYLQVPEGIWQWFELTPAKRMKAIRFFYNTGRIAARTAVRFGAEG